MTVYHGVPINEGRLLTENIILTVLLICFLALGLLAFILLYEKPNRKDAERIRTLREQAGDDAAAQKRLARMERKYRKKQKKTRMEHLPTFLWGAIALCAALLILFMGVIPGWTDYQTKDYTVYEGRFEVVRYVRSAYIKLEDGTSLQRALDYESGTYVGTLVYATRSKLTLGGEAEPIRG